MTMEPTYFTEFKKELFGQLKYKFDGISEQLGKLTEQVIILETDVKEIKEEMKRANKRGDQHSEAIMMGIKMLHNHDTRLTKLEKEIA